MESNMQRSAFIAIVGRPNVGKSSVLNALIGKKIAIVSRKPQTTRTRITGIYTKDDIQIVFTDTPGLLKPKNMLGEYMLRAVNESVAGVDACILVVEAGSEVSHADKEFVEKFKKMDMPAVLVINKIDTVNDKTSIMDDILKFSALYDFQAVVPVSALRGSGINELKAELEKLCIEGMHFFDEDSITDQPDKALAAEIIREKILRLTDKEVPHGVAVVTELFEEREDSDIIDVTATIVCEKDNHKGIIIGKHGDLLKKIGTLARIDLEKFYGCKINLQLWVKVKEDWRNNRGLLANFGYDKKNFEE